MSATTLFRNEKSLSFIISFVLHAVVFLLGGIVFVKPIQYAVELGTGGVEVSLTAAPAELTAIEPATVQQQAKPVEKEAVKDPDDMPLPKDQIEEMPKPQAEVKQPPKQVQTAVNPEHKGDGSSAIIGKDNTTFYSAGGAIAEAKPNYLRNPAPVYPWEARQNGWQGVVILKVFVDKTGHPVDIQKEQSSGHNVLDESALKTVRSWRFQPALMGNLPVDSFVRIPIRFELNKK